MMCWKIATMTSATLACGSIHALIEQKIDEKKPIPVVFSQSSHNRISVEGGSVEKVFGDEHYFHISLDPSTGNAFVNVVKEIAEQPSTLTVVTSSGFIQDLYVSSSKKASEHLILNEDFEEETVTDNTPNLTSYAVELLNRILEGKVPFGYGQRPVEENEILSLPPPLDATLVKAFESSSEDILVFNIKNTGKRPIILTTGSLKIDEAAWVFLNAYELKGKQEAVCIMALTKNEG